MATGIHTLSPPCNINFMGTAFMYSPLGNEMCGVNDEFSNITPSNFEYMEFAPSVVPIPFNLISPVNTVNYSESLQQRGFKMVSNVNPSKELETDEGYISCTKKKRDKNAAKNKKVSKEKKGHTSEIKETQDATKSYLPKLYQPQTNPHGYDYQKISTRPKHNHKNVEWVEQNDMVTRNVYGLMKRFKTRAYKMKFDLNPPNLFNGGPWDDLNHMIWQVFTSKVQKEETYMNKLKLWQSMFLFSRKCFSNYALYLVGSTMTGFALEGSDIDLCFLTKPITDPRLDGLQHLETLKRILLENGFANEAELIRAKVPILKFKNNETGFDVDLSCNNSVGVQNTRLLYSYSQMDWRVRPLVVVVKVWAHLNGINDAKNMTISSYSWALMVIHYLQCGVSPAVLPCLHTLYPDNFATASETTTKLVTQDDIEFQKFESSNTRCLGDLLIVRTGTVLPIEFCKQIKTPKNDPHQWKFLCIEEPFNCSNTARSVFNLDVFKHIKRIIVLSYKELACRKKLSDVLPLTHLDREM